MQERLTRHTQQACRLARAWKSWSIRHLLLYPCVAVMLCSAASAQRTVLQILPGFASWSSSLPLHNFPPRRDSTAHASTTVESLSIPIERAGVKDHEYYDNRERIASRMTFEWQETCLISYKSDWIREQNEIMKNHVLNLFASAEAESGQMASQALDDLLSKVLIDETIVGKTFELTNYYTITRYSQQTYVRAQRQVVDLNQAGVSDDLLITDAYLLGNTAIEARRDSSNGQVTVVHIAQQEIDALGIGTPLGGMQPEWLVVYAGVSPFRLHGRAIEDWHLVSVSPQEWVFESPRDPKGKVANQNDEDSQNEAGASSTRYPYVRFHLDRRYQDALSRLEIRYSDGTVRTWRTLKYKWAEGTWWPSEVEVIEKSSSSEARARMTLVSAQRTRSPIDLLIPEKTPVFDYRRFGKDAWEGNLNYERTEWSEALLESLRQSDKKPTASP